MELLINTESSSRKIENLPNMKHSLRKAMYKNRNAGTGDGMRGTRGMGEGYILGNVAKHSGECPQTF